MPHTLLQESNAVRQQRGSRVEQRKVPIDYLLVHHSSFKERTTTKVRLLCVFSHETQIGLRRQGR